MGEHVESTISTEVRDHILLIGLDRAKKRNAFNMQMLAEIAQAYTTYEEDDNLRCAVLFAHGDHFTAGLDLAEVGPAVAEGKPLFPEGTVDPLDMFGRRRTKPVICTVQGWCLTIGIELLLASDIRIAAQGTRFRQMEVNRGIMPFGGATLRFPQIAGWGNAMRYILTGAEFSADEALRIGLIQEVAEPGQHVEAALSIATEIAKCAPLAVQATMMSSRIAVERGPDAARAPLMEETRKLMASEDAAEGVKSFVERREAKFVGR